MKRIAVVGAGPAGLACAYALQKKGVEVTVFEKNGVAGGRMRTYRKGGYYFNSGATMLINHYHRVIALAKELGIEPQLVYKPAGCKIKVDDHLYPLFNDPLAVFKMEQVSWIERLRLFFWLALSTVRGGKNHFFSPVKPLHPLDPLSILRMGQVPFSSRVRLLFWLGIGRVKGGKNRLFSPIKPTNPLYKQTAEEFFLRRFDPKTIHLTLGTIVSLITLLKLNQISVKDLIDSFAVGRNSKVCFFPEGIDTFPKALASRLSIRYNSCVQSIAPSSSHIALTLDGKVETFDRVVLAIPPASILSVYPEAASSRLLRAAHLIPTLRLAFLVPLSFFKECDFVIFPIVESEILTGANCSENMFTAQKKHLSSETKGVLAVCIRSQKSKEWFERDEGEIFADVKEELCRLLPAFRAARDQIEPFHLERWEGAVPGAAPEQVQVNNHFWEHEQGRNGVYLCGDFLNMMWVEGAIRCGEEVAHRIISSKSHAPLR